MVKAFSRTLHFASYARPRSSVLHQTGKPHGNTFTFSTNTVRQVRSSELAHERLPQIQANATRLWSDIHSTAQWGKANRYGERSEETGLSRLTLSADDKKARDWFRKTCESLGCNVHVDHIGNVFAIRPGRKDNVPATFVGSHLDSQPRGGRFDGILGVCAGVEMLRVLDEHDIETEGPVGVVNWTNEEGARFPISTMGSSVWAGKRDLQTVYDLQEVSEGTGEASTVQSELARIDYKGEIPAHHKHGIQLGAHFELHIEQGPYLEQAGQQIGVVEGVQAYKWFSVTVKGRSSHTGTTGYEYRADALHWASQIIFRIREIAERFNGLASVGVIHSEPQSVNTVPDKVSFTLDIRHKEDETLAKLIDNIMLLIRGTADESAQAGAPGVAIDCQEIFSSPATVFDKEAVQCVEDSAVAVFGLSGNDSKQKYLRRMVSGAGHDSMNTQLHCPSAMVFVPCRQGISHNPREWCEEQDCANGTSVLIQSVLRFDRLRHEGGHLGVS